MRGICTRSLSLFPSCLGEVEARSGRASYAIAGLESSVSNFPLHDLLARPSGHLHRYVGEIGEQPVNADIEVEVT